MILECKFNGFWMRKQNSRMMTICQCRFASSECGLYESAVIAFIVDLELVASLVAESLRITSGKVNRRRCDMQNLDAGKKNCQARLPASRKSIRTS
jgi:hypothetical protein